MSPVLPLPTGVQFIDPATGGVSVTWQNYLLSISSITGTYAPTNAQYYVATSDATLTNDRNLGALTTGFLFITVAAATATPSSVSTIPVLRGGSGADLSATGGANQVVQQTSAGGNFSVGQLSTSNISGLTSNLYTPTLTAVANVAASTPFTCQYLRVGTVVTVSGKADIDPTAGATLTQLGISLPIASNFGAAEDCGGTAVAPVPSYAGAILADAANDRAELQYTTAADVANRSFWFSFTYQII